MGEFKRTRRQVRADIRKGLKPEEKARWLYRMDEILSILNKEWNRNFPPTDVNEATSDELLGVIYPDRNAG